MKATLAIAVLPAVLSFSTTSVVNRESSLRMSSIASPPGNASPDPDRRVPIPQSYEEYKQGLFQRGDVMIDPDWKFPKHVVVMGPLMLMMYPSKR